MSRPPLTAAEIADRYALVQAYIERLADAGLGWPGYRVIARDLGLPEGCYAGSVQGALTALRDEGWMRFRRRGQRGVEIELADGRVLPPDDGPAGSSAARHEIADALLREFGRTIPDRGEADGDDEVRYLKPRRADGVRRPCIRCGRTMVSQGPHHRMCDPCRSSAAPWLAGAELVR